MSARGKIWRAVCWPATRRACLLRLGAGGVVLGLMLLAGAAQSQTSPIPMIKRWALLVGINRYADPQIRTLRTPVNDVTALYAVLSDPQKGGFDSVTLLTDEEATNLRIRKELRTILQKAGEDDLILFFFSGHGWRSNDMAYLITHNADLQFPEETTIPARTLMNELMHTLPSQKLVVILDNCFAGAVEVDSLSMAGGLDTSGGFVQQQIRDAMKGRIGSVALYSSRGDEQSYEMPNGKYSVFSYFLLRALGADLETAPGGCIPEDAGDADENGDGMITTDEVYKYVRQHVRNYVEQCEGKRQTPWRSNQGDALPLVGTNVLMKLRLWAEKVFSAPEVTQERKILLAIIDKQIVHEELNTNEKTVFNGLVPWYHQGTSDSETLALVVPVIQQLYGLAKLRVAVVGPEGEPVSGVDVRVKSAGKPVEALASGTFPVLKGRTYSIDVTPHDPELYGSASKEYVPRESDNSTTIKLPSALTDFVVEVYPVDAKARLERAETGTVIHALPGRTSEQRRFITTLGPYRLVVSAKDHYAYAKTIHIMPNSGPPPQIKLNPYPVVNVRLTPEDAAEGAVDGVHTTLRGGPTGGEVNPELTAAGSRSFRVPVGSYTLETHDPSQRYEDVSLSVTVSNEPTQTFQVTLNLRRVDLTVLLKNDRLAVGDVNFTVRSVETSRVIRPVSQRGQSVRFRVVPGPYAIDAEPAQRMASTYGDWQQTITVRRDLALPVRLPFLRYELKITTVPPEAIVQVRNMDGQLQVPTAQDQNTIYELPAGDYEVHAEAQGCLPVTETISLHQARSLTLRLDLDFVVEISPTGSPVPKVIDLESGESYVHTSSSLTDNGWDRYVFRVPAGLYQIEAPAYEGFIAPSKPPFALMATNAIPYRMQYRELQPVRVTLRHDPPEVASSSPVIRLRTLNGRPLEPVEGTDVFSLLPGEYMIEGKSATYDCPLQRIQVAPTPAAQDIPVHWAPLKGILVVSQVVPSDAQIWAERLGGPAGAKISLQAGHPIPVPIGTYRVSAEVSFAQESAEVAEKPVSVGESEIQSVALHIPSYHLLPNSSVAIRMTKIPSGTLKTTDGAVIAIRAFEMSTTEVTNEQFAAFVKATNHAHAAGYGASEPADFPVQPVSWEDAVEFAKWAGFDLPTENEWVYAALAGRQVSFGTDSGTLIVSGPDMNANTDQPDRGPVRVASYAPNPFGLYDMTGNVSEWCRDFFFAQFQNSGDPHVLRGGSWKDPLPELHLRYSGKPNSVEVGFGFRVIRRLNVDE